MYKSKVRSSSSGTDPIIGEGGLIWGYDNPRSPDAIIQTSFIDEMSSVGEEVRSLLDTIKSKEALLKDEQTALSKRQLRMDIKEKELKTLQQRVDDQLIKLEKGSLEAMQNLEKSISELRKENQRLRDSFCSMSKNHGMLKSELEMAQSKNAKLEKQLSSANGRIKNLIKLQTVKPKEVKSDQDKENSPVLKPKKKPKKENAPQTLVVLENSELLSILMKTLSTVSHDGFRKLCEDSVHHQPLLLSSLISYLKTMINKTVVLQYPCLKLTLKCICAMNEEELGNPTTKASFRKLSEVMCIENNFAKSPHLHSRLLSNLVLLKSSLQIQVIQSSLKQILLDLHEDGAKEILIDNAGHLVLLSNLKDPLQHTGVLNILILLTVDLVSCQTIIAEITSHIPDFLEIIQQGNPEVITSVSIMLQRLSTLSSAKYRLKQSASLFRRLLSETTNSLVDLNLRAVLMNTDCFHQIPIS